MLTRPEPPARRLPYTTADMAERLAKRFGVTNPPVQEDKGGGTGLWPSWGELGNAAKMGLGTFVGAVNSVPATALDTADEIVQGLEKVMGVDSEDHFDPAFVGSYNLFGETYRGFDNAAQYVGKQIAATPGVGKPSSSPFMDTVRSQGWANAIAEPFVHAVNVGSVAYPVSKVAVGAKLPGTITNAYSQRLLEREIAAQNNLFPAVVPPKPGTFIELVEDADGVLRVPGATKPPATPATRLAEAQTQRALPPSVQRALPPSAQRALPPATTSALLPLVQRALPPVPPERLAQLQREATRAEMGISIDDIEFPPQKSMTVGTKGFDDVAAAEAYANEIAVSEGRVRPEWPLKDKLQWPEFKKPYEEFIANARASSQALDSFDHIHPESWIEIGEAQARAGFNYDQMPNEMLAIQRYFSNQYGQIQEYLSVLSKDPLLRNKTLFSETTQGTIAYLGEDKYLGDMKDLISNIDRAFQVAPPVTQPFTVYRGVSIATLNDPYAIAFYKNLKPGDLIYDPAYSSTSIDKTLAERWAGQGDDVILVIQVPKGSSVVHPIASWAQGSQELQYHNYAPSEKELLLNRNSVFKVIKINGKYIEVELIPANSNTSATNVRTASEELQKTMSMKDALSQVKDPFTQSLFIAKKLKQLPYFPDMSQQSVAEIGSKIIMMDFAELNSPVKDIFDDILAKTNDYANSGYTKLQPEILITKANNFFDYLNQGKLISDTKTVDIKKLFEQYINKTNYKQPNSWLEFLAEAKAKQTPEEEMFS